MERHAGFLRLRDCVFDDINSKTAVLILLRVHRGVARIQDPGAVALRRPVG
jgi:hypothetical protein